MFLCVGVVIYSGEEKVPAVVLKEVIVFLFPDLVDCTFRAPVVFQLDDNGRDVRHVGNQGKVGVSLSGRKLLYYCVF